MQQSHCCHPEKRRFDYLLWLSLSIVLLMYLIYVLWGVHLGEISWLHDLSFNIFSLMNTIWWGIVIGAVMVAGLSKIPRVFVVAALGNGQGFKGIVRAAFAGVLLDLCSHGILMVGSKLYERGASAGQVMAFLIASPWNSFSLTLILIALIGFYWTLWFIVFSMLIAIATGYLFNILVGKKILPDNPHQTDLPAGFRFWRQAKQGLAATRFDSAFFFSLIKDGIRESRMVMRWLLFGVVLAALIKTFVATHHFEAYFGPSLIGLMLTVMAATIIEVCSEGSAPIAADILTRAAAPGNSFAFLMTGVSTDYTEIMVLKETTRSWKIALFLPLLTVPQILLLAWLMNG